MNYNKKMNAISNTDPSQQKHQHQQQKSVDGQNDPLRLVPCVIPFADEIITTIHPHDVLCERKGGCNDHRGHEGNKFLSSIICEKRKNYFRYSIKDREREKSNLIESVVDEVKGRNPPGRFLKAACNQIPGSWILLDKKDCLANIGHALFDKVDRLGLKQKKQKNKLMIKNYLLSAAAIDQAEKMRMQSISIQQQRQRKVAPQPKRLEIDLKHRQAHHLNLAQMQRKKELERQSQEHRQAHHLHLAQMQRKKELERQKQEQEIKHRQQQAFEVQELHTRSQQLQELRQREQQLSHHLQLQQQEMQRKIELERQEQEQQNHRHQQTLEEQERYTRYQKLHNPLKSEHQRQLELIHEEQQRRLKQHSQLQLERKLQQQLTQLRQQQQQFPHSAEDDQNTLHFITRSRSNTETTLPQEVGSSFMLPLAVVHPQTTTTTRSHDNNKFLNSKDSCSMPTISDDALTKRNSYILNKQRTLSSLLFATVPENNDYGNLVSAPNSFIINNNESTSNAAAVGVSDNINHLMPLSVAPPKHPITSYCNSNNNTGIERYESKYDGYASSNDSDSKKSLVV